MSLRYGPMAGPMVPIVEASSGRTPFGFAFGPSESVVVTEAEISFRREPRFHLTNWPEAHRLESVSPTIPNQQNGACWVAITGGNRVGGEHWNGNDLCPSNRRRWEI